MKFPSLTDREQDEIVQRIIQYYPHGISDMKLAKILSTHPRFVRKALKRLHQLKLIKIVKVGSAKYYFSL